METHNCSGQRLARLGRQTKTASNLEGPLERAHYDSPRLHQSNKSMMRM